MAENVEEIEAKLAAYVDGELTPAERVEIETYLQSNPSHRTLLQDLVLHRNLLRGLPREKAPGDCTEGFQGQLERDILLGGDELSRARRRFRIHYSPQLLSAAAIILVAVALGIIVYTVLPPHQPHAPIAQLSTEPSKTAEPALTESRSDPLADVRSYKGAPADVMSKKSGETDILALKDEALGQKMDTSRYAAFKTQAEQQPIAAGDMMVITVTADDVKGANEAVVSYLALNKINYTAEAEGFWRDGVDALAAGRRLAGGMVAPGGAGGAGQSGGAAATGAGLDTLTAAQLPALRSNVDEVAKREEAERGRLDAPRPDRKAEFKAASGKQDEKQLAEQVLADKDEPQRQERFSKLAARPAAIQPQPTASATTQPSAVALGGNDRQGINDTINAKIGGGSASGAGAVLLKQQQVRVPQSDQENAGARVILARNMNDQQVRDLAACMSQPERNVYATVQLDRSDAYRNTGLATLARFDDKDQKEHSLTYQRPAQENEVMLREKVVAANAPAVAPTTRPAESFALNIKPAEAGLSRGASDDAARVNGTKDPNSNAGKFQFGVDLSDAAQQPQVPAQQQAFFGAAPPTQPTLGRGTRDLYTCVIVVQNTSSARASGPATQPVAGKPTTAPTTTPPAAEPAK